MLLVWLTITKMATKMAAACLFSLLDSQTKFFVTWLFSDSIYGNQSLGQYLLSCQPRVAVTSFFVYKVIKDLESIYHLCINPIHRIGLIHKWSIDSLMLKWSVHVSVLLSNCKHSITSLSLLAGRTLPGYFPMYPTKIATKMAVPCCLQLCTKCYGFLWRKQYSVKQWLPLSHETDKKISRD